MMVLHEMRRRARFLVAPVLGVALTGYFIYHIFEGDRGLYAWRDIARELHTAQQAFDATEAQRAALARKVDGLDPAHVDPDLLDQQVRSTLNLVAPGEIVVIRPGEPR
jgi:cell division protein FtsB